MLSRFRKFYASKTPREKVLLIAIIWAPAIFWLNSLNKAQKESSGNRAISLSRLEKAELAISMRPKVEENLRRAMGDFDEKMLVKDLSVEVEGIIGSMPDGSSSYSMSLPEPKPSGRMTIHAVNVSFKNVSLETLADFERRIIARAPYISMSNAELNTDGKGVMSARYEINSFEFNDKTKTPNEKNI